MIDHSSYFKFLSTTDLSDLAARLQAVTDDYYAQLTHGDLDRWLQAVESMPILATSTPSLNSDAVTVGTGCNIDTPERDRLKENLMHLHPWRKGPFKLFGVDIDAEWRCNLKWDRVKDKIDLTDKLILDVGCGNGYYMYRMLGAGAKAVVGIDPTLLFVVQFAAINKYVKTSAASVLPLKLEDLPKGDGEFDFVFSMGILYHRRDPKEHISQLLDYLKPAGQLILETIVLDKPGKENLVPPDRYGKMRNVWNIPTVPLLCDWLTESGCGNIQIAAVEKTTSNEQRKTDWMTFESLTDYLDPSDPDKTVEGHPAPVRAVIIASK